MLDTEDIERIAAAVARHLDNRPPHRTPRLVDAATVAAALGVKRDWVYAHAFHLGAMRLGGPKGRLRFDLDRIAQQLAPPPTTPPAPRRPAPRPRSRPRGQPAGLLPIRGR